MVRTSVTLQAQDMGNTWGGLGNGLEWVGVARGSSFVKASSVAEAMEDRLEDAT